MLSTPVSSCCISARPWDTGSGPRGHNMPITPQELIANLGDLPPLPQVASQVLRVSADPDASAEDLRKVIAMDQALTSQILKISNSAMFGMVREVTTLTQAIMTLGFSTIKS